MSKKFSPQALAVINAMKLLKKPFTVQVEKGKFRVVSVIYDKKTGGSIVTPQSAWMSSEKVIVFIRDNGWLHK